MRSHFRRSHFCAYPRRLDRSLVAIDKRTLALLTPPSYPRIRLYQHFRRSQGIFFMQLVTVLRSFVLIYAPSIEIIQKIIHNTSNRSV